MSEPPADPYRGSMLNYSPHNSGRDARQDISYGAPPLPPQDRPIGTRYSDTTHSIYVPSSTFSTDYSAQRHPSHYDTHGYTLSPMQGSRKRQCIDNETEASGGTDHNYGYRHILQNPMGDPSAPAGDLTDLTYAGHVGASSSYQALNQDYLPSSLPQQHHHHRLPSQAFVATGQGSEATRSSSPQIDRSHLTAPGMPARFPRPKAPKTRFTPEEDERLIELKEVHNLCWRDIAWFFPGRKQQTLQVRYSTKLKERIPDWGDVWDQKLRDAIKEYEDKKWTWSRSYGMGHPPITGPRAKAASNSPNLKPPNSLSCPKRPASFTSSPSRTMFLQRTASALARRSPARAFTLAQRPFSSSIIRSNEKKWTPKQEGKILTFDEIKVEDDLFAPGAKPGTIPTDVEQATGLERLELIGKMQGIDIFDMRPLDASRKGSLEDPIIVNSAGDEQYAGCTGFPADSHQVNWLTVSRERPIERCLECGNVVKMNYIGPEEDPHSHDHDHGHHHPPHVEPKTFADYVKPDYWYR
ncbi:Cytochrome c oxidase, subunit Vb [Penicillium griseofulvum]|uniref:Cytochrome c oxidase subunit 4, mitochondrial n=1 Tax=Penicillium patulum TaxID=5078 RepID=A0A135LDX5_PENPA|nr:Cytochrome c oxidase, subunit Vb [Penicillium griseofulvum]KXG47169.1 Cytochrome c oxidase, subunit Vb [Penicillium griseofulvum]